MPGETEKPECNWSNNNLACVYTWLDLNFIKQIDATFDSSANIVMSKLRFWNPSASPAERRLEAQSVAAQLAKMFTGVNFAKYEAGKDFTTAVEAMTNGLTDGSKTMCELAVVVDEFYNFFGELKI